MGKYNKRKSNKNRKRKIIFIFIIIILLYISVFWKFVASANIDEIATIKTKAIITGLVNDAVRHEFSQYAQAGELLLVQTNAEGSIEMVQANTSVINNLLACLSKELQNEYSKTLPVESEIPLGSVLGSKILSQSGPAVKFKIIPISVSGMDFKTEFESQGINQTKYKVYVTLNTETKILAPFSTEKVTVSTTILVAETIILGKVPSSYVSVPENEILDGMDN